MKYLRKMALIVASSPFLLLASCDNEDTWQKMVPLNKNEVKVSANSTETISTSKKGTLKITDILLRDTINKQTFSVYNPTTDTVVVDMNGRDAGRVIYHDGNIEKIVIDGWVEITKTSKSSFTVKGIGNSSNYGYTMQVGVSRAKYTPSHILIK